MIILMMRKGQQEQDITTDPLLDDTDEAMSEINQKFQSYYIISCDQVYYWSLILLSGCSLLVNLLILGIFIRFRDKLFSRDGTFNRNFNNIARHHNQLLLSMVFGDLLVSLLGLLLGFLLKTGQVRDIYKLAGTIPLFGFMFVSIFSLAFLTIDRAVAGNCPLHYNLVVTDFRIKTILVISWIVPLLITITGMVTYIVIDADTELKIRACILVIFLLIAFAVLVISNGMLIIRLRRMTRKRFQSVKYGTRSLAEIHNPFCGKKRSIYKFEMQASWPEKSDSNTSPKLTRLIKTNYKKSSSVVSQHTCSVREEQINRNDGIDEVRPRGQSDLSMFKCSNCSMTHNSINTTVHQRSMHCEHRPKDTNPKTSVTKTKKTSNQRETFPPCTVSIKRIDKDIKRNYQNTFKSRSSVKITGRRERKMTIMCICVTMVFFICWLPLVGYRFSYVIGRYESIVWLRRFTFCLALFNSFLNPCIYFLVRKDFRNLLWKWWARHFEKLDICHNSFKKQSSLSN